MRKPTAKQVATRKYMISFVKSHKRPPTLKEIGNHFGIAIVSAFERVQRVKKNLGACPYCGKKLETK